MVRHATLTREYIPGPHFWVTEVLVRPLILYNVAMSELRFRLSFSTKYPIQEYA